MWSSPRLRVLVLVACAVLGVVAAGAWVLRETEAAFSATTGNAANSLKAGTVALSDDDGGAAAFSEPSVMPGDTLHRRVVRR